MTATMKIKELLEVYYRNGLWTRSTRLIIYSYAIPKGIARGGQKRHAIEQARIYQLQISFLIIRSTGVEP